MMRVHFVFEMKRIPLYYRLGTLSILKEMIRNGSSSYYKELFEKRNEKMKPISYSNFIKGLKFEKEMILGDELHMNVSSLDYAFIMHLMNDSKRNHTYFIHNEKLILKNKILLPKKTITKHEVIFKTLSPVLIDTKDKKPVLATEEDFSTEFEYTSNLILKEVYGVNPEQPIELLQSMMSKEVIKERLHQKQNTPLYLTGNKGLLHVRGNPKDLQKLYEAGVSMRRSLGFGLLDIEREVV